MPAGTDAQVDAGTPADQPTTDPTDDKSTPDAGRTETIELEVEDLQFGPDDIIVVDP